MMDTKPTGGFRLTGHELGTHRSTSGYHANNTHFITSQGQFLEMLIHLPKGKTEKLEKTNIDIQKTCETDSKPSSESNTSPMVIS